MKKKAKNSTKKTRAHYVLFHKDSPYGQKVVKNRKKYDRKKMKKIDE